MEAELAEDISDAAFINQRVPFHDGFLLSSDDVSLVSKRDLGIRDDGGRKKSMRMSAMSAEHSADMEDAGRKALADGTIIVTMYGQTGGVPTGRAGQLMELEGKNEIVIKSLCQRVA